MKDGVFLRKILAFLLLIVLLFQMTSCYRLVYYYLALENASQTEESRVEETTYWAETKNSLHFGEPLESYVVYHGLTDALPVSGSFRPSYRQGICREFKGTVVVVLLFMDDDESAWTEGEVLSFTNEQVMPALDFLKREAALWNVELDFVVESYSTPLTDYTLDFFGIMPTEPKEAIKEDAFEQAAGDLGFASDWIFYSYLQSQYSMQEIVFLTIFNKDGRAYASQKANTGYHRFVEHCVLYGKTEHYPAQTVAHEIMHLFGAEDLYEEATSASLYEIANAYYPKDIMVNILPRWENNVDAYSAYAMGWTNEIPEPCFLDDWHLE